VNAKADRDNARVDWNGYALIESRRFGESLLPIWRASQGRDAGVSKAARVVSHIR
jgi:hypothetical protein